MALHKLRRHVAIALCNRTSIQFKLFTLSKIWSATFGMIFFHLALKENLQAQLLTISWPAHWQTFEDEIEAISHSS